MITNIQWNTGGIPRGGRSFEGTVSVICICATIKKDIDTSENKNWTRLRELVDVDPVTEEDERKAQEVLAQLMAGLEAE